MIKRLTALVLTGIILFIFSFPAYAQDAPENLLQIKINIPSYRLVLTKGNEVLKKYSIAVGKPATPTPLGNFSVLNKVVNPTWYPPWGGKAVPTGPQNPLGYRWIGFKAGGYGIHGTNSPSSISKAISHGCIRMHNRDVEELFGLIKKNIPVLVGYDTIEITETELGEVMLTVYPDIYGKGKNTLENLRERLEQLGYMDRFSAEDLKGLIAKAKTKPESLRKGFNLYAEDQIAARNCLKSAEEILVPINEAANLIHQELVLEGKDENVSIGSYRIPVISYSGTKYVKLSELKEIFAFSVRLGEEGNQLEISNPIVPVQPSNQLVVKNGIIINERVYIPVDELSPLVPMGIVYYPDRETVSLGTGFEIKYLVHNGIRHIGLEDAKQVLIAEIIYKQD